MSVLDYRAHFVERATPIDACSMVRAMSQPADYPAQLPVFVRALLDRQDADPCVAQPTAAKPDSVRDAPIVRVTFESFVRRDSEGVVRLLVRSGENVHREDYSVREVAPGSRWAVTDVRIWGAIRAHFVNP